MKSLKDCYNSLAKQSAILDVGCLGFEQMHFGEALHPNSFRYFGIDYCPPKEVPPHFNFKQADLNKEPIPFPDDSFDLVVAKHIIEHLKDPVSAFSEFFRVCKPGGLVYIEAPSERSLLLPGMFFSHDKFFSLSFFDDPTHFSRPWTPQSLYRMTKLYGCDPLRADYQYSLKHRLCFPFTLLFCLITKNGKLLERAVWQTVGWASYLIAQKPSGVSGKPIFNYYVPNR